MYLCKIELLIIDNDIIDMIFNQFLSNKIKHKNYTLS